MKGDQVDYITTTYLSLTIHNLSFKVSCIWPEYFPRFQSHTSKCLRINRNGYIRLKSRKRQRRLSMRRNDVCSPSTRRKPHTLSVLSLLFVPTPEWCTVYLGKATLASA